VSTPEEIKLASNYLRGEVASELVDGTTEFGHDSIVLLKFHGIYQQDDRDTRRAQASKRLPLDYSCMVRAAVPSGVITTEQWLALDQIADLADGTLRLTTRQGVQFHVVLKDDLHRLVHDINATLLTTLAACGDVVRNIMGSPFPDERQAVIAPLVGDLVARFRPQTTSYWELWVDGEKAVTAEPAEPAPGSTVEPVYGETYLPRKFKIGVAWPGDNSIDVYTQDVGLVPTLRDGTSGEVTGYVVFAGGGLGMSHAREDDTYPRLGSELGWVPPERVVDVVEAVVTTQRDYGNRGDRHRARLKYLIDDRGLEWFRGEVESRSGLTFQPSPGLPEWGADDHLGWTHVPFNDTYSYGIPISSGRVADRDGSALRTALRELATSGLVRDFRVTARQDLLLTGVAKNHRATIEKSLRGHGVALADDVSALTRLSIACPALPTCGQALGEAERVLPQFVELLDKSLADAGAGGAAIRMNMTGCPNGCARPYTAEIGVVGRTKTNYDIYVGGAVGGQRLAERLRADVPFAEIPALLSPVFAGFASDAEAGESFGDYCARVGTDALVAVLPAPTVKRRRAPTTEDAE
jgi:sulfite reductase (ferredoxin)